MQRRILNFFILLSFISATNSHILADDYNWQPVLKDHLGENLKYISNVDKEKMLEEEGEISTSLSEVRESIFSLFNAINNVEKYRPKPTEQYYDIARRKKYNDLIQAMLTFLNGKEKGNKILDKNTIESLEILRGGNFIDKICLYFNLDKLKEDKITLGEEEAIRRYTDDISLDKIFFLSKILNYQRDNHALVENRQILELLCEDPNILESLFQNLQQMKQTQEFLLLFNDQISFLNQCGFSDIEFEDCLDNFGYIDNDNIKEIIEYGQDTSIRERNNINFYGNKRENAQQYSWELLDWINPLSYISWYLRKNKRMHVFFDVLHMKKIIGGVLFILVFKHITRYNSSPVIKKISDVITVTILFDFIFRFMPSIKNCTIFALLIALVFCFVKEEANIIALCILTMLFLFLKFFCGIDKPNLYDEYSNKVESAPTNQDNAFVRIENEKAPQNEQGMGQNQHLDNAEENLEDQRGSLSVAFIIENFITLLSSLLQGIIPFLERVCEHIIKYWGFIAIVLFVPAFIIFIIWLSQNEILYKNSLHKYLCKNLEQRTLYTARKYVQNMRSFYNTIKKNTSLYNKLRRRLKTCYFLFDKDAEEKLTEKQAFILTMLGENDDEIYPEDIVKFFALFDQEIKSTFKKAISEIYDISTYVNSAHLVSTKRYCIARFIKGDSNYICMKSMLHPYLTEGIKNNVVLGERSKYKYRNMLFTGSNRSGKTTFIAAVALNVLLAHVFGIAFCEECILTPFDKIIAIFNYETDINDQQSKFSNEIKILRQLLSYLDENKDLKILFASDEQFSSTDPETANYLMSCFISSIYLQKNITSLNSTHLALPRKLAVLFQDSLGVCNVSLKTIIEEDGNINFKRTLISRNGIMIGEQLARNMGFFDHLDPNFVQGLKKIKY